MALKAIDPNKALSLVSAPTPTPARTPQRYAPPIQHGPLRFTEREERCTSRNCGSPTYIKVDGMTMCYVHALRYLNDVIHKLRDGDEE